MLHIIILNKNYFPAKLNNVKATDKVIILAAPDGSIPVSAYKDELLKNMEVKLLPEIKDTTSEEGKNALRIAQAMLIGQLTSTIKDFEIYTDDTELLNALTPFTGKKASSKRKAASKGAAQESASVSETSSLKKVNSKGTIEKSKKEPRRKAVREASDEAVKAPAKEKAEAKGAKVSKADVKTKPAKLPTQAEVKRILGAANSSYAKPIMEVIKKSNQITFEMDLRMKLVEAGMDANQCKDLAKSINEEFGKSLPASM